MRLERTIVALIVHQIGSSLGTREVSAQSVAEPPRGNSVITLEPYEAGTTTSRAEQPPPPSGQSGRSPVRPSYQAQDFQRIGGNAAIARLPNPFGWEGDN